MPILALPQANSRQPQGVTQLQRSNQLCAGIASLLNMATKQDVVTRKVWTLESGASVRPLDGSMNLLCGAGPDGIKPPVTGGVGTVVSGTAYTLMLLARVNSLGTRRILLADYDVTGATAGISIEQTAANTWWLQHINTFPQQVPVAASSASVTTGWHWLEIVFAQSVAFDAYVDGVNITHDVSSAITNPRRSGPDYRIGRPGAYPGLPFDGDIAFHGAWNRRLSDQERAAIRANPWQLFANGPNLAFLPSGPTTVFYPGSDIIVTWSVTGAASHYAAVGETTLNRSTYITSPDLSTSETLGWDSPIPAGNWDIQVDGSYLGASGQVRLVLLDAGGSAVGTSSWITLTGTDTTYTVTVTTTGTSTKFRYEVQA